MIWLLVLILRQILRHRETIEISHDHHEKGSRHYDIKHVDIARTIIVYPNICWMVHDRGAQGTHETVSGRMPIRSEQSVRSNIEFDIILDTVYHHDIHLLCNIPGG